jgi:hypothetical protein
MGSGETVTSVVIVPEKPIYREEGEEQDAPSSRSRPTALEPRQQQGRARNGSTKISASAGTDTEGGSAEKEQSSGGGSDGGGDEPAEEAPRQQGPSSTQRKGQRARKESRFVPRQASEGVTEEDGDGQRDAVPMALSPDVEPSEPRPE